MALHQAVNLLASRVIKNVKKVVCMVKQAKANIMINHSEQIEQYFNAAHFAGKKIEGQPYVV